MQPLHFSTASRLFASKNATGGGSVVLVVIVLQETLVENVQLARQVVGLVAKNLRRAAQLLQVLDLGVKVLDLLGHVGSALVDELAQAGKAPRQLPTFTR